MENGCARLSGRELLKEARRNEKDEKR